MTYAAGGLGRHKTDRTYAVEQSELRLNLSWGQVA